jgi:hypothetical protein
MPSVRTLSAVRLCAGAFTPGSPGHCTGFELDRIRERANRYSVSFGNANLKAETGDDIDVLFEHYLKPFGVISGGYFYKYGVNGPLSDIYFYSHFQVDAQGSIRLAHGLSLVMYGLNLNDAVFGFYQGSAQYMIQREFYQPTVRAGFRWSPLRTEF